MNLLYREYLPNFSSSNFNVGMDEPWELGQGWSADKVKTHGKAKVYLNHLDGIRGLGGKIWKTHAILGGCSARRTGKCKAPSSISQTNNLGL